MANLLPALTASIAQIAEKVRRYRDKAIGEQNTKASLIEPLLECLGWDIRDLDSVHREYRAKPRDKPVDYALKILRRPRLFIEAKGLGENLSDRKWVSQVLGYATVAGVEWSVLTDGNEYRIYNATAPVDAEEKLFRKVCIADEDASTVSSSLHLISRSNLEENLLNLHWEVHFVDRRVKAAIIEMVNSAHPGLIRLIHKKVPDLTTKSIAGSLARLDVKIEAPPIPLTPYGRREAGPGLVKPGRKSPAMPRAVPIESQATRGAMDQNGAQERSKKYVGIRLSELIAAGMLKAPLDLFCKYKGHRLEATLLPDGSVQFGGAIYNSSSMAADEARRTLTGRPMSTNGWSFWLYDDGGVIRELDYARQLFLAGKQQSPTLRLKGSGFHAGPLSG